MRVFRQFSFSIVTVFRIHFISFYDYTKEEILVITALVRLSEMFSWLLERQLYHRNSRY